MKLNLSALISGNHQAVLLLGSNLGDRLAHLTAGILGLSQTCGRVGRHSAVYESEAWGATDQDPYLNVAVALETSLSPEDLLCCCHEIEAAQGRERTTRWAARTLDIDILFYEDKILDLPYLKIPHPLLSERRFVLEPLAELIPDFRHPQKHISVKELLSVCADTGDVWLWNPTSAR